jgi:hypothetical protein
LEAILPLQPLQQPTHRRRSSGSKQAAAAALRQQQQTRAKDVASDEGHNVESVEKEPKIGF